MIANVIPVPIRLGPVFVEGLGELEIQPDVTAYEAAKLAEFFVLVVAFSHRAAGPWYDFAGWVREHHLERHFQERER